MSADTPSTTELLPCPFCGGSDAEMIDGMVGSHYVRCRICLASTDDGSRERAIAAWNTRARIGASVEAGGEAGQVVAVLRAIIRDFDNEVADEMTNDNGERADLWVNAEFPVEAVRAAVAMLAAAPTPPAEEKAEPVAWPLDAMIEAFEEQLYGRHVRGWIARPLIDAPDFREPLKAALSLATPPARNEALEEAAAWHDEQRKALRDHSTDAEPGMYRQGSMDAHAVSADHFRALRSPTP